MNFLCKFLFPVLVISGSIRSTGALLSQSEMDSAIKIHDSRKEEMYFL